MNAPRKPAADTAPSDKVKSRDSASTPASRPEDLQPASTGANRGSPAAGVMKQFAKTKAESSGRS